MLSESADRSLAIIAEAAKVMACAAATKAVIDAQRFRMETLIHPDRSAQLDDFVNAMTAALSELRSYDDE